MCVSLLKDSLEARRLTEQEVDLADRAERNVKRMVSMLDELTEATSVESKGVLLRRERCDLQAVVKSALDSLDDARARRVDVESLGASSHVVLGDAVQLERVVVNLFTNALKYSAEDARVIARLQRTHDEVVLEVVDRGIGIGPGDLAMLFERYYRTTPGKARASGLGLGLYIARHVVEAHGGRISVTSVVGAGSRFTLSFPAYLPVS
jgi:signal transduction histidine kinase